MLKCIETDDLLLKADPGELRYHRLVLRAPLCRLISEPYCSIRMEIRIVIAAFEEAESTSESSILVSDAFLGGSVVLRHTLNRISHLPGTLSCPQLC